MMPTLTTSLQPKFLLLIFCTLNLLIYIDRGAISSNGVNSEGLQIDFNLSIFQSGLLPTAFMVGLLVSSPIFAEASKHAPGFHLIAIGISLWSLSVAGCGLSIGFTTLLLCRMAVGIGESSFVALAAPFIDKTAPEGRRALWIALFYLCIPVGYAVGVVYGAVIADALHWRAAFIILSIAAWPFIAFFFFTTSPIKPSHTSHHNRHDDHNDHHSNYNSNNTTVALMRITIKERVQELFKDVYNLFSRPMFIMLIAGSTCFTAVVSSLAYYGPQAAKEVFLIQPETADAAFGSITILTGILGTLNGGVLLDKYGNTLSRGSLLCGIGLFGGFLLMFFAFFFVSSFPFFCIIFACSEFFLFTTQAPSSALIMWSVPLELRPLAISLTVVVIHVFGDVPIMPIIGAVQGYLENWRVTMCLLMLVLLIGTVVYGIASRVAHSAIDYRQGDEGDREVIEEHDGRPLILTDNGGG